MKCKIQRCPSEAVSVVTVPSARGAIDCAYCDVHTLGALRAGATMTDREPTESPPEPPKQPATSDPAGGIVISDVAAQATQDAEAPACSKAGDPGTPFEAPDALTVEPGEPDRTLPAPVGPAPSPTSPQVVPMPAAYPPKCQIPGCDNLARGAKVGRVCKTCQWRSHTLWGVWTPTADQIVALPDAWAQRVAARHYGPVPPPVVAHADAPPEAVNAPTAPKAGRDGPKMGDNRRVVELRAEVNRLTAALEASNARNLVTIESVGRLERERDEARAVIEQIRTDPTPDDGLADESIEACKILGIDTTQDYDYLGSLRRLLETREAAICERMTAIETRDAAIRNREDSDRMRDDAIGAHADLCTRLATMLACWDTDIAIVAAVKSLDESRIGALTRAMDLAKQLDAANARIVAPLSDEIVASSRDARACKRLLQDLRAGAEGSADGSEAQLDAVLILLGMDAP